MQGNSFDNKFSKSILSAAVVIASAAILSACGGGGSTTATSTPTPVQSTPQPSVAPSNPTPDPDTNNFLHTSAVAEDAALAIVNKNRNACGFGNLAANSNLKNSAYNHANYMGEVSLANHYAFASHSEITEKFTDATVVKNTGIQNS